MKARCVICDEIEIFDEDCIIAKRLRNHPTSTYLCEKCNTRINEKTLKRLKLGKHRFLKGPAPSNTI